MQHRGATANLKTQKVHFATLHEVPPKLSLVRSHVAIGNYKSTVLYLAKLTLGVFSNVSLTN